STYAIRARPAAIVVVTSGISPNGTTLFTDIQGGAQESTGFEAEFFLAPVRGLELYASLGTCDAIYTEHPTNPALDGAHLVAAPERVASAWAKYVVARRGDRQVTLTAGVNHVGSMAYVGNNPLAILPAYTTVDLGVGCAFRAWDRAWTVDVLVKNVANERYYVSNSSWGFPRHAIATISTRF
ncbi:MAG: TonB-dependent receptor, partial [Opitutaceae bacterium]|nr:TonB-dependent receptor [Opitutaceae bacterium]